MTPTRNDPDQDPWNAPPGPDDAATDDASPQAAWQDAFAAMGGAATLASWALAFPDRFFAQHARLFAKPAAAPPAEVGYFSDVPLMTEEQWKRAVQADLEQAEAAKPQDSSNHQAHQAHQGF